MKTRTRTKKQELILISLLSDICKVFCVAHAVAAVGLTALIFITGFGDADWWKLPAALIWMLFVSVELANLHSGYQARVDAMIEENQKKERAAA